MLESQLSWQFWIDRGGTFTDIVARKPDGGLITHKLLSENPEQYQDAAIYGIEQVLAQAGHATENYAINVVKIGTTVGTNALLERKGEPTALVITQGFKDCLRIGYQDRPDIFALNIQLPEQLYQTVIEIAERIDAKGNILTALNSHASAALLQSVYDSGIRSIAIVLLHAWRYPEHELKLAQIAQSIGFTQISISHLISPLMKVVSRGDTTVVDAYLSPLLKRYVAQVERGLQTLRHDAHHRKPQLLFMQSNGGLVEAGNFQGKDSILSGPAGGIVGAVGVAKRAGLNKIIAFDMGGTSTDVAHYAGEFERNFSTEIAGVRMRVPMMNIHTVAAGGGSILSFDGQRYQVGPNSAGANPGPASYRRGGPLTVTDANLMLGKLPLFPAIFGEDSSQSLDIARVKRLFAELAEKIRVQTGNHRSPEQVAEGFLEIAIENMAAAIKKISVQKGYNVAEYTLCCFGAAGGQHACKVADSLAMKQVLLHPFAGVLSAYGIGLADFRLIKQQALESLWDTIEETQIKAILDQLEHVGRKEILLQVKLKEKIRTRKHIQLRYQGTDTAIQVDFSNKSTMLLNFQHRYKQQFGFIYQDKALIIESVAVEVIGLNEPIATHQETEDNSESNCKLQPLLFSKMFSANALHNTPVYRRNQLPRNVLIAGPAIVLETTGTTIIEPGWQGEINQHLDMTLTRIGPLARELAVGTTVDPVMLEIFNKLFMSVAEQMGFVLQNTAYSVNIKERLDFSCAIFDHQAQLIANAPHIPVHLGSMGESVKALLGNIKSAMQQGDVFMLNSPYLGGTHLPDLTVVTPIFHGKNQQLLFFVASRGHHADIGGITPGSMPAHSHHIQEEGLLTAGLKIVANGKFQEQKILQWLNSGVYPARNPQQNIADLQAQVAANEKGMQELLLMVKRYSLSTVQAYMHHVQENAAESVRQILSKLKGGRFVNEMDSGAKIVVAIEVDQQQRKASIDFTGTSQQLSSNFNAPKAVCKAAVLYVFRTLVGIDIPLNDGCLIPLTIIIPEASMLDPEYPAAVVAGNVETSQYIVDALYGALGILASSQGTMNNFTFGNAEFQYYETICGGAGAGQDFAGCDAVHTHMTNSRITDPEVLEWRFPVQLEEFSIRQGSGGLGRYRGGEGVCRKIRFLQPMTASILSSHRLRPGFGVSGGGPGKTGQNTVICKEGVVKTLAGCEQIELTAGDIIIIETPGGGGYGKKHDKPVA